MGKLAYAYGLQPEPAPCTPESLISGFSWVKVPKQDVCLPEGLFSIKLQQRAEAHVFGALPPFCFVGHCPAVSGRGILKGFI